MNMHTNILVHLLRASEPVRWGRHRKLVGSASMAQRRGGERVLAHTIRLQHLMLSERMKTTDGSCSGVLWQQKDSSLSAVSLMAVA